MSELLEKATEILNRCERRFEQALNSYARNADEMCEKYEQQCELASEFVKLIKQYEDKGKIK